MLLSGQMLMVTGKPVVALMTSNANMVSKLRLVMILLQVLEHGTILI